ncbi:hypothetical protein [Deinococcus sp. NW-56]|uniref:hypothetical protein n=1 Tax=Deinococcus sp. NW-56 TaxID=2080419 RepID=UPI000CF51FC2|nr:hypothetical protein [Deinococcus sp. NW-56]
MTSRPTEGGKPPLLSREMRLVLVLLLLLALLGGWFVWTSNRDAAALADVPAPTPTGDPPAGGEEGTEAAVTPAPGTPQEEPSAQPEAAVPVEPSGEIEVPQIPAFGAAEETDAAETAEAVPTPGGINPDTPLAALPGRNPFRPLELERTEGSEAPASPVAAAPQAPAAADPVTLPASEPAPSSSGALALSPLPGTGASRPTPTPSAAAAPTPTARSSGALPTPTLPGTGGVSVTRPAPATTSPTASAPRTSRPSAAPSASRPAATAPTASTGRPSGNAAARPAPATSRPSAAVSGTVPPAPRPAPVAGVSVPRDAIDLGAAAPGPAASPAPAPATAPGTPQPVTQFGLEGGVSAASPLGTLVQTRALEFDAAVLGPVNTAIFRSKEGYVVVSQGQTLPDSDAVVREVRAAGVTLELGGETLDLGEEAQSKEAQPTGLTESLPVVIVRQPADAFSAWGDLAVIAEFDVTQADPPADPRLALALVAPTPDLSRDQGEP